VKLLVEFYIDADQLLNEMDESEILLGILTGQNTGRSRGWPEVAEEVKK
jgi:hypothetical protein